MKLVASLTSESARQDFVKEVAKMQGGKNILDCIQCGACSGSCPTRFAMDYSPMHIIRMIHMGMKDKVLSSSTIVVCSTCYTCATRCPRVIDITTLMMSLRNQAMEKGYVSENKIKPKFHRSFFDIVNKYGRLHEPELLTRIIEKTNIKELLHAASLGWRLMKKGRLQLRAPKITKNVDLQNMLEKIEVEK